MCRQQQHPHLSLLLMWCSLLTVAVVAVAVALVMMTPRRSEQNASNVPEMQQKQKGDAVIAPTGATSTSTTATRWHFWYIQLTYDGLQKRWIQDLQMHNSITSIFLRNNSVILDTGGIYYFYALATFYPTCSQKKTVLLVRNEIPGRKQNLTLSEVVMETKRSVSFTKLISCEKGDSVRLVVNPTECLQWSPHKTYWGLFLLSSYF